MIVSVRHNCRKIPAGLRTGVRYTVLGIEADCFRLMNTCGEPCLYDSMVFDVMDSTEPHCWITSFGEEGERYSYPQEWNRPGFFEDWHDGVPGARELFDKVYREYFDLRPTC